MAERRKTRRRHLLYYGRIYDERMYEQLGYLVDITETGMMMLSEKPFAVNESRKVRIEITDDVSSDKSYLTLSVRSIWCEPDIDPDHYNAGFEILEPSAEDIKVIKKIIEYYGFRDN